MEKDFLTCLIILLISITTGMIICLIVKPVYRFHGPNANAQTKKIYKNNSNGKCFNYGIKLLVCPKKLKIFSDK